jgi:O-antigen/teichoic acid export membrane protein
MKKKFTENFAILLLSNLVIKPFWIFGIDRKVQLMVGAEEYGNYFSAMNLTFILSIFLDMGINSFTTRAVARSHSRAASFITNFIPIKIALSLVYFILTIGIAFLLDLKLYIFLLVLLTAANQIILSFLLHIRAYISGLHLFKTDAFLSILDKLLAIIFILFFWFLTTETDKFYHITMFALLQGVALLVAFAIAYSFYRKNAQGQSEKWKFKYTRAVLLKSLPFALLVFQMGIYGRIDGVLLNYLLPQNGEETGIYAAGFRLLDAATQFGFLLSTILLPMFGKSLKLKQDIRGLVMLGSIIAIGASTFLAIFTSAFGHQIVDILYHTHDPRYSVVLSLLMFTFIPISSIYIFGTLLTANGDLKKLNIIAFVGIVLNLSLNFIFIPKYAAKGAAISALVTQSIVAIMHILVAIPLLISTKK